VSARALRHQPQHPAHHHHHDRGDDIKYFLNDPPAHTSSNIPTIDDVPRYHLDLDPHDHVYIRRVDYDQLVTALDDHEKYLNDQSCFVYDAARNLVDHVHHVDDDAA
jgi:hypothetical protein